MIIADQNKFVHEPLVSVRILAYNHEKYITRAIESVLNQKCDFLYEILIGEDCSTDSTRLICLEYQKKYPDIIKLILNDNNIGLIKNYVNVTNEARGKYIACCAGDDYWCDDYKLTKQVDFLEKNSDYSMCFTNAYEESNFSWEEYRKEVYGTAEDKEYFGSQILEYLIVPASTVVYRNNLINYDFLLKREFFAEDLIMYLKLNEFGKLRGMSDITTVYTRHTSSIMFKNCEEREKGLKTNIKYLMLIDDELNYKYHNIIKRSLTIAHYNVAKLKYKNVNKYQFIRYLFKSLCYDSLLSLKLLLRSIIT